jgi:peptidoglycan/xylan/chitin deacetylase (PgdA/CDA1 family)
MVILGVAGRRAAQRGLLLALLVALIAIAVTDMAQGKSPAASGAKPSARSPGGGGAGIAPGAAGKRYRVVGCVSRGAGAYDRGPARREVAFAFDDGPARDTPAFVGMLERLGARATFFMIGRQVTGADRRLLLRELADGDALGDHTFNHANLVTSGRDHAELAATIAGIAAVSGYSPCVFRPPYGAFDRRVLHAARALGLATIMWDVDPRDWSLPGTRSIVHTILREVRPGSIVISHDGGGPRGETLAAYPTIIKALRKRGYSFVTVPELLGFRPVYRECAKLCEGLGLRRNQLPRHAIVQVGG